MPVDSPFIYLDVGATSEQMCDFFGWANVKMAGEYISTNKVAVKNVANKMQCLNPLHLVLDK